MEFRYLKAANEENAEARNYLTKNLSDKKLGHKVFEELLIDLGNSVDLYPQWHPLLTLPSSDNSIAYSSFSEVPAYRNRDHTRYFLKGFVTCPYSKDTAESLIKDVCKIEGLDAYPLEESLYMNDTYPVVVKAYNINLEGDGTIRSRDAIAWFTENLIKNAMGAQVAETWWSMRSSLLGSPHGSRSSLFVNQYTGRHIRKILETLNNSGVFGPIKEWSLDMLSQKKRAIIGETLIRAALNHRKKDTDFNFELCGETCCAEVRDTWKDNTELFVNIKIGNSDLWVTGYYDVENDKVSHNDPVGKRELAEKFL